MSNKPKWKFEITPTGVVLIIEVGHNSHHISLSDAEMSQFHADLACTVLQASAQRVQTAMMEVHRLIGDGNAIVSADVPLNILKH
jgi:hypothetical protein